MVPVASTEQQQLHQKQKVQLQQQQDESIKEEVDKEEEAESLAAKAVVLMQECINVMQSVSSSITTTTSSKRANRTASLSEQEPNLFQALLLDDLGLVAKIERLKQDAMWSRDQDSTTTDDQQPRFLFVSKILWPLLHALYRAYRILDDHDLTTRPVSCNKPAPPLGLLSLQNYTDIACFLELLVCCSIISPLLEQANTLASIHHRLAAQHLPKAMAGRFTKPIVTELCRLLEATPVNHYHHDELVQSCVILGNLLLLDRFRPMFLPRHVADLYAAMFQIIQQHHHCSAHLDSSTENSAFQRIVSHFLPSTSISTTSPSFRIVDPLIQARAYQLLLSGKPPPPLRRAVAQQLVQLSETNLASVIAVFVSNDCTATSSRLAWALTRPTTTSSSQSTTNGQHDSPAVPSEKLVGQVVQLLDMTTIPASDMSSKMLDVRILSTIWALFDHWSPWIVQRIMLGNAHTGNVRQDLHDQLLHDPPFLLVTLSRVCRLLSQSPPRPDKVCHVWLVPLSAHDNTSTTTLLSMVLEVLAKAPADGWWLLSDDNDKGKNNEESLVRTAKQALQMWARATMESTLGNQPGVDLIAVALLQAIAAVPLSSSDLGDEDTTDTDAVVAEIQARAKVVIQVLLLNGDNKELACRFFLLLLSVYLQQHHRSVDTILVSTSPLVPMVCLPLICEECSFEQLLGGGQDTEGSSFAVLIDMIQLSLGAAAAEVETALGDENDDSPSVVWGANNLPVLEGFRAAEETLASIGKSHQPQQLEKDDSLPPASHLSNSLPMNDNDDELLITICSIVLSLLISILELGERLRSVEDEKQIQSLARVLERLATATTATSSYRRRPMAAEISQMASHALALVAGRRVTSVNSSTNSTLVTLESLESDLASNEPPIRARAVVTLRHLAARVVEEGNGMAIDSDKLHTETLLSVFDVLKLAVGALKDAESFVYLAAIQTIAFLGELRPKLVIPILGSGVATGQFYCGHTLSNEQRIKLCESLISLLGRKATIREYLPQLVELLVFGDDNLTNENKANEKATTEQSKHGRIIQVATDDYFVRGRFNETSITTPGEVDDVLVSQNETWEAITIRVKTGGPLFQSEECDLVHAGKILVVAQAVSLTVRSYRYDIVPYTAIFTWCATDALQLGSSRPVRRAGALLASTLYEALAVVDENVDSDVTSEDVVLLAREMARGGEENLAAMLERCVKGYDLTDLEKERFHDQAAVARCTEALLFRAQADEAGILSAGLVALGAERMDESFPLLRTLRQATQPDQQKHLTVKRIIEEV